MAFMDIFQVTSILVLLAVPLVLLFNKIPTRKAPSGDCPQRAPLPPLPMTLLSAPGWYASI